MTDKELSVILDQHNKYLTGKHGGVRASLEGASLENANLVGANLRDAILENANLVGANLRDAILENAILVGANLRDAILVGANLRDANLRDANLVGATKLAFFVCPKSGSFIAWKKLKNNIIAQLEIPADAKRTSSLVGRKCRADFAKVIALFGDGEPTEGLDTHTGHLVYRVGETVYPDSYNDDNRIECAPGIHFFITRAEAFAY